MLWSVCTREKVSKTILFQSSLWYDSTIKYKGEREKCVHWLLRFSGSHGDCVLNRWSRIYGYYSRRHFVHRFDWSIPKSRNLRASEMRCRNCGSTSIKLSMVSDGVDYNATSDHVMGVHVYSGKSKVRHKRVAVCQSCGYSYDYIMPEEVAKEKEMPVMV